MSFLQRENSYVELNFPSYIVKLAMTHGICINMQFYQCRWCWWKDRRLKNIINPFIVKVTSKGPRNKEGKIESTDETPEQWNLKRGE